MIRMIPRTQFINTISQFDNSDVDAPNEFQNSEPSQSTLSQPPFHPIHPQLPDETSPAPSSYTDATSILSPLTSYQPPPPIPVTEALEKELGNFITLQQQLQNTNTLTLHQLSHSVSSSESLNQTITTVGNRAHRVFQRKHHSQHVFY